MAGEDKTVGCSAEGHVSHVYSDRMSLRPSVWCRRGAEEVIYTAAQMIRMENKERLEAVANMPIHSIPYTQVKKIVALKDHIWVIRFLSDSY